MDFIAFRSILDFDIEYKKSGNRLRFLDLSTTKVDLSINQKSTSVSLTQCLRSCRLCLVFLSVVPRCVIFLVFIYAVVYLRPE